MRALLSVIALLSGASSGRSGEGAPGDYGWALSPWVVVPVLVAVVAYAAGMPRLRQRSAHNAALGLPQAAAFALAMVSIVVALTSPLDAIADDLFSVHMIQHLILLLVTAPLLVWARPLLAFLWALPRPGRKAIGRIWAGGRLGSVVRVLSHPVSAWIAYCGVFVCCWHVPGPYAFAEAHEAVHDIEHVLFLLSGAAFWSVVIEPSGRRRLSAGATIVYLSAAAILSSLPGALMILTERPFYAVDPAGAARWGLSPIADQQLAGLIMWIPGGAIYLAAISILFVQWLRQMDRRPPGIVARAVAARTVPLLLGALLVAALWPPLAGGAQTLDAPPAGNPTLGAAAIVTVGCGACHIIPGVLGANGLVGPPLDHMGRRIFIAGLLTNTPDNMLAWLSNPQAIVPGNAMPNMGLTPDQARDIAAYLATLQ